MFMQSLCVISCVKVLLLKHSPKCEARRTPEEVSMGLAELWAVMEQCIERGSLGRDQQNKRDLALKEWHLPTF